MRHNGKMEEVGKFKKFGLPFSVDGKMDIQKSHMLSGRKRKYKAVITCRSRITRYKLEAIVDKFKRSNDKMMSRLNFKKGGS